ncbi:TraR/DksA C4-type zinc finger protein [bacterium]|nr:TraR/DksA C4-type zinc finger protein [bacterium]
MAFNEKDLAKFEELLLKKRKELLDEMGLHGERFNSTVRDATGDLSSYSYHMADQGTDNMDREMAFMFASKSGRLVYHIDMALKRIKDGTYGDCHSCGKQIGKARLMAVPHARLCIECKSAEEEKKAGRR